MFVGAELRRDLSLPNERVEWRLLTSLLDSLREAAFIVEEGSRRLLACNDGAERVFGYPPERLENRQASVLHVDARRSADFDRRCSQAAADGRSFHCRFWMRRADGSCFPSEHTVTPLTDVDGRRVMISMVRDLVACDDAAFTRAFQSLTTREQEVFAFTALGHSAKEVALELGVSHRTVEIHRARILQKFQVRTTRQLLAELALAGSAHPACAAVGGAAAANGAAD